MLAAHVAADRSDIEPERSLSPRVALNALLSVSVFVLLYLLLTRCACISPHAAVWPALAGALYPSITVLSQVAMTENLLFSLTCVWLITVGGLLTARDCDGV